MLLRESPNAGEATWDLVRETASQSLGEDERGYRQEFLELVDLAANLASVR